MSFTLGYSTGPSSALRFSQTRGRMGGGAVSGLNYPSPFFDVAHTYLPTTVKQLFRYCRYYFLTNPLINATVFKLAEYPVTDLVIDHDNEDTKAHWTNYFHDHLQIRSAQIEIGLDYFCYGISLVSLSFPFIKYLQCRVCKHTERADKCRSRWVHTNFEFRLTCPKCESTEDAIVFDHYIKNASGIRLVRWNPEDMEVEYNEVTGESTYYFSLPQSLRNDVIIGKKNVVETTPQIFIQALRQQKAIVMNKSNLFVMKRPNIAWQDRGWGCPIVMPVLKDVFQLQVMKKSMEAILLEHIVPLRLIFPQAASGTSDPFTSVSLVDWKDHVAAEIARWRYDNNYIPIMPLPLGYQAIGGDGKALLIFNEIQAQCEHIILGMGVPKEFLYGGLSYSGSQVSMRMLENAFISYVERHKLFVNWVVKMTSSYMKWPEVSARFKPFTRADDVQRKSLLFQYNQAGKVSDSTLLADIDLDQKEEDRIRSTEVERRLDTMRKEQLGMAQIQADAQAIMMKEQAKLQQDLQAAAIAPPAPGEPGAGTDAIGAVQSPLGTAQNFTQQAQVPYEDVQQGQGISADIIQMAQGYAETLRQQPPAQQRMAIQALSAQSPELAQLVQQFLGLGSQPAASPMPVDMRPLPAKNPPRREMAMV